MKELDQIVENFFQSKPNTLGLDQLVEMVEDTMNEKISNRGEVIEGIAVAAIAAKLAAREKDGTIKDVTLKDIQAFVVKMTQAGQGVEVSSAYSNYSPNCKDENGKQKNAGDDTIAYSVRLPQRSFADLKDQLKYPELEQEYKSAALYVNNELHKYATRLYTNCESNEIKIAGEGTKNQTGTKVDIFMTVDGKKIPIQTSMKGRSKQLDQRSGFKIDKIKEIFGILGVTFADEALDKNYKAASAKIPKDWLTHGSRKDVLTNADERQAIAAAFAPFYDKAAKLLNNKFNADALIDVVRKSALGEENKEFDDKKKKDMIQLLKFFKGDYKLIRFGKNLENAAKSAEWVVRYEPSVTKNKYSKEPSTLEYPYLNVYLKLDDEEKRVLSMRPKIELESSKDGGPKRYKWYPRNYIQAEDGLYELGRIRTKR